MKKQNVRTLSLIVCSFTYLLIGAAVFDALESEAEREDKLRLLALKYNLTARYNISDDDWGDIRHLIIKMKPHNAHQWKFSGAFFYAMTVFTTVGYGHSTPRTPGGKMFTIVYAMVGIPLGLVMFQSIGERLNVFVTFLLSNIKRCFRFKDVEVTEWNLVLIVMSVALTVIAFGTVVFSYKENWKYLDSFYYIMVTLTTIGFGDFVALQSGSELDEEPGYVAFTIVFILFAMTVLSATINLLVLRFMTMNTEDESASSDSSPSGRNRSCSPSPSANEDDENGSLI